MDNIGGKEIIIRKVKNLVTHFLIFSIKNDQGSNTLMSLQII